jgi:hypothetical protein
VCVCVCIPSLVKDEEEGKCQLGEEREARGVTDEVPFAIRGTSLLVLLCGCKKKERPQDEKIRRPCGC